MMFDAAAVVAVQDAMEARDAAAHPAPDFAGAPHGTAHPGPAEGSSRDRSSADLPVAQAEREERDRLATTDPFAREAVGATAVPVGAPRDIIFIDTAVDDYRQLADEWAGRGEIVLIDGTRDGIAQMQAALAGQHDIGAIHIVSHGSEGMFWLGTTRVTEAAITGSLAGALGQIGESLRPGGDILIYGCDFAEGTDGASALSAFAAATHADVAASTDITGYGPRGGDWTLEAHSGVIEARALDSADWVHTLDPDTPVPISVTADSLTVTDGAGNVVVTGTTGYGSDARSPDMGVGAVAVWKGAATYQGQRVDLRATVVSISSGDAIRFNRPTGTGANGDDPTFLLRDLTAANDATVQIRWDLVLTSTGAALPADVRFTILDIDGIGGNPNTRESVTAATTGLAYYTRERVSDIDFTSSLSAITASGTQDENTVAGQPLTPKSAATFDWKAVSSFTLTYKLTTNAKTTQAQFYHDGDADFGYSDPVYVSIPRLDLDGNDNTATGNDAHFTFTEKGAAVPIVDSDVVVTNPMDIDSITGATVRLENYKPGDTFTIGTLPSNITASIGAVSGATQTVTLSGTGSESDYATAFRAITFSNTSNNPDTTQRVIDVSFSNNTLTSAVATSRIDVVAVNDAPTANPDGASTAEDHPVTINVLANDTDPEGDALTVTSATALHGTVVRNADGTLTYTPNANYNGTDTISYAISDGHGGTSSSTVAVRIAPQPDAPVNGVPGAQAVAEDGVLTFSAANGNALTIADPDGGMQTVTIAVTHGTFTLGGTTGLTFSAGDGSADATMTFTGSIAQINAALDTAHFNPDPDANGAAQLTLTTTTVPVEGEDFQNGDAEAPNIPDNSYVQIAQGQVPGWETTASDGLIEIWGNGYNGVQAYHGRQFFEVNATQAATLYQEVRSVAGSPVTLDFAHRGRAGVDVMRVTATDVGADGVFGTADDVVLFQQDFSDNNTAWGAYSRQLTASATGNVIRVAFSSVSTATGNQSVGNFLDGVVLSQNGPATSDSDTVPITITPVADIAPDMASTPENTAVTYDPFANDTFSNPSRFVSEIDGHAVTAGGSAVAVSNGQVALGSDGRLTFTPTANYHGTTTYTYTVTSSGTHETATETVTVTHVNHAPVAVGTLPARNTSDAATVSYATAGGFNDVDGDTLTYFATGLPSGLTIDAATGIISGTIDRSASQPNGGSYAVVVTARDPSNASATQTFTIAVTNPRPVANNDSASTNEDTAVTIAVLGNDSDPDGDPLTVTSATALHGSVVRNPDGTLTYTPNANYNGSDTISYTISDGQGGTASATVAVTINPINDTPTPVGTLPARNGVDAGTVSFGTASSFTDVDGDALTYSATGLPNGLTIDAATGVISGTIDRSASQIGGGSYAVTVTARDPSNASATQTFTYSVTNPAPTATNDTATTAEDTPVTIAVLGNDSDPDGDPLTVTSASALHGTVVRNADGTVTYTPNANYNGTDTISYAISDGQGGTASATVAVTINPVNDAPTPVGTLPARNTSDAATVSYATANGFTDVDGDTLTYSATGLPNGLTINAATGVVSGTVDRSASQGNGGHYSVVVTARDPSNASATQTFTIDVANPAPTAANDSVTTHVDTPVTIAVLANDSDPDGDPLTVTSASGASHGTVSINPDGTLRYVPNAGYAGSDTLTYTISDGQGGTASATVTIAIGNAAPVAGVEPPLSASDGDTIDLPLAPRFSDPDGDTLTFAATGLPPGLTIDPATGIVSGTIDRSASQTNGGSYDSIVTVNDGHGGTTSATLRWGIANPAPTARDDIATTPEDQPIIIAVLGNDSDPDGDPLTVVAASAAHGSAIVNPDGTITYMPAPDFNGTDTVTYTIDDGNGGRSTAHVTVTVTPVDDAPTTTGLPPRSTVDNATVSVATASAFGDRDGDTLTYSATGLPPGLTIDPMTGVISGTIDPGSVYGGPGHDGVYHAVVTARDPSGATATAPFDWSVTQAAPVARDDHATTPEDTPVSIAVLTNDSDGDGDALSIVAATATHGTVYVSGGNLVFYPAPDFNGVATLTYTIADPSGNRATATVTVDVTPVNDAPVADAIPATRSNDAQQIALDVGGFFRDPDGDALTYGATGLPPGLTIDPATGRIGGTVDRAASQAPGGLYHVTVTATDSSHAATGSSFDWTIVNPAPVARDDAASTPEDTGTVIAVLGNDSDPDGDPLTVISATAGHGTVSIGADNRLTYTPAADFNGNDLIAYTIDDGNGGRASASVLVTVTPVNDAPVAVQPHPAAQAGTDGAPLAIDTVSWFRDADGDTLTYAATGLPAGLSIDPATGAIRGTLDRSASQSNGGVYPVIVTARDPSGAAATSSFDIRVTNPAPVANNDVARTMQDGPGMMIPVLSNDRDPDGDPLRVVAASADHGSVTIKPDGRVAYVPNASFVGSDLVHYTISDSQGGFASATVTVTVMPLERPPVAGSLGPVDAIGGRPVGISVLPFASDPDGDRLTVTSATTAVGVVRVDPDGTIAFIPPLGFSGITTIGYTISDGRGGAATGTVTVRVADGRGADIEQLLRIGRVTFHDPLPSRAAVSAPDGVFRNPLSLLEAVDGVRALRGTAIGAQPVGDAVAAIRSLHGTDIDPDAPILAEVSRLDTLRDQREAGDRLFDRRWSDFVAKGLTGFSAAADRGAGIMVESVVHGGAIWLEVRDTAGDDRCPIRSVDIRLANGGKLPEWIKVDRRGMAIIERAADMDELHLVVRVTRTDGRTTSTPILVQGETGEVELDRHAPRGHRAAPLDLTLQTPSAAIQSEASRLASYFQ